MSTSTWSEAATERFVALETPFTYVRLATIAGITALYFTLGDRSHDHFALPVMVWAWVYNLFVLVHKPHRRYPHRKTRWWTAAFNLLTSVPWIAATGGLHSPYVPLLYLVVLSGNVRFPPRESIVITLAFLGSYLVVLLALGQLTTDPVALAFQMTFVTSAGLVGMVFSVVFLQQVERRMRVSDEAVRARDDLISVAGHDLRTPLHAAKLNLELLERNVAKGADLNELAKRLDLMMRQLDKLAEMTGQLLDVSRVAAGRLSVAMEQIDLGALVRDVVIRLFPAAPGIPPVVVETDGPVVGRWDRGHLEQIAANLVGNAVKYGDGSQVNVHVDRVDGAARLEVTDHGAGIAPEERELIFARSQRGSNARGKAPGAGLGLWITRRLVESMGGEIHVASTLGVGSTFSVELPLSRPASH
jgi:signal transduction histidine kinase